ncbi:L,D-transpeptidase [Pseudorhizobium flavum]|uniref:Lipoprotein-anchoring transpeptidase ErfK/SrfK n=1 Tax=Pseudorhizobium flavum TaxID=1335061 RepID=A0A7W9YV15_9HYPH|nr:L,D-transpeptidase [Pseudorhizobium flavum]MBB6178947.1 lipoprotein-anchoring transpeptidase ErfK/SrfK [Pseudorhizobium flavum]CAD6606582.1 L,D-transpeptidase [Pseudorhizobium flavum]
MAQACLYIHENGKGTCHRIDGTPEAFNVGKAVSSGCIRLINQDAIHHHNEVSDGRRIVAIPHPMKHVLVG